MADNNPIREALKQLIVESLHLERLTADGIEDDAVLFGDGLGLDSVDALELVVAIERRFGIEVQGHEIDKAVFTSVTTLAAFVASRLAGSPSPAVTDGV